MLRLEQEWHGNEQCTLCSPSPPLRQGTCRYAVVSGLHLIRFDCNSRCSKASPLPLGTVRPGCTDNTSPVLQALLLLAWAQSPRQLHKVGLQKSGIHGASRSIKPASWSASRAEMTQDLT